jgi:Amt family ammonium transporter
LRLPKKEAEFDSEQAGRGQARKRGEDMLNAADTAWMLTSTVLVLFMTLPGLALFYAGLVRAKNILSVLMHCVGITCVVSVLWLVVGYSLTFTEGSPYLGGLSQAFLLGLDRDAIHPGTGIPETVYIMYQLSFAVITPALIVGAYVERIRFSAVLLFSGLWLLFVYVPVAHWVWGGGWLAQMGVMDFAGGIVVHTTAGVSALVIAIVLGRRDGFPHQVQPPHAPWMVMVGACMLWVGWFGFNAGSAVASNGTAGMAMLVTHMSAAVASLTWMLIEWVRFRKPSMVGIVTGSVAGLATITPASGYVGVPGALIIGVAAGAVCYVCVDLVKRRFVVDDSLDVFAVHGVGGITGTLLTAFLAAPVLGGVGYAEGVNAVQQFGVQVTGVVVTAVWSVVVSFVLLKVTQATVGLRTSRDIEAQGLDLTTHGENGYNIAFGGSST